MNPKVEVGLAKSAGADALSLLKQIFHALVHSLCENVNELLSHY